MARSLNYRLIVSLVHVVIAIIIPTSKSDDGEPTYATCGECHCVPTPPGDENCPSDKPMTNFSAELIQELDSLAVSNPFDLDCDPYKSASCETNPPQTYVDLGDAAVCAVRYNSTLVGEEQCPTQYELKTYPGESDAEADNAYITHFGACGACSTTQDLAAYMEHTDLQNEGRECTTSGIFEGFDAGVECYKKLGFTEPCSRIWVYNGYNTAKYCTGLCVAATGESNNGPPPDCTLNKCLQCDEDKSGPIFQAVAGRTRRRSGMLSAIVRPCADVLLVDQTLPCDALLDGVSPTVSPTKVPTDVPSEGNTNALCYMALPLSLLSTAISLSF